MAVRKRVLYIVAVVVIVLDTFRRIFVGSRPIDILMLVIELLVLMLIGFEVGTALWHKLKMRRRRSALLPYLERGQKLLSSTPEEPVVAYAGIEEWIQQVKSWTSDTRNFLDRYSSNASFAFMSTVRSGTVQRAARRPDDTPFLVSGRLGDAYQLLQSKLDNLRRIVAQPEAYF